MSVSVVGLTPIVMCSFFIACLFGIVSTRCIVQSVDAISVLLSCPILLIDILIHDINCIAYSLAN